MPEAFASLHNLKMITGNSSETETSTTPSSNRSNAVVSSSSTNQGRKKHTPQPNTKKSRRSSGRRAQKKAPLKSVSQQKTVAVALHLKSQIPRALLLTPSTSTTSLTTNISPSPRGSSHTGTPRPQLQRQNTSAIVTFRARKSFSQMDLKHARRTGNLPMGMAPPGVADGVARDGTALVPNLCDEMGSSSQTSLVSKFLEHENYYYIAKPEDPKVAGMKIFATIMLNAWRKRRDQVKRLSEEVNDLKRGSIKAKNQLHVFNTLFRVEQRRNDELSCQLKRSLEDISHAKSSCESLTTSLISLKADKALLEQELQIKEQESDGLNAMLTQTKSDLFKAMTQQRELQAHLSCEQRKVQTLENQKNDLINEICELNNDSLQKEQQLKKEIELKDSELTQAQEVSKDFEMLKLELKRKDAQLCEFMENEVRLKKEIVSLQSEAQALRQCLSSTLDSRLKSCWNNAIACQAATLHMLHWIAFCILPATPPPKINALPFGLTLDKALSIVKR